MQDVTGPKHIHIIISEDGKRVWINDEKKCLFRACGVEDLRLEDWRKKKGKK